jgi:hypothetical protein
MSASRGKPENICEAPGDRHAGMSKCELVCTENLNPDVMVMKSAQDGT